MSAATLKLTNDKTTSTNRNPAKAKPARKSRPSTKPKPDADLRQTAALTVLICAAISGLLNAYAMYTHSPTPVLGIVLGCSIPVIVLRLGKVTGKLWKRGNRELAYFAGCSGVGLLLLSVYHCAEAVSILTGSSLLLSVPLAVAIDCGLVACELAAIAEG
jgi:hypothetical protein